MMIPGMTPVLSTFIKAERDFQYPSDKEVFDSLKNLGFTPSTERDSRRTSLTKQVGSDAAEVKISRPNAISLEAVATWAIEIRQSGRPFRETSPEQHKREILSSVSGVFDFENAQFETRIVYENADPKNLG
jgi:hypothetical protein